MSAKHDEEKDFTPSSLNGAALRRRAEEKARSTGTRDWASLSPEEGARLLHELQVHQIELEMQNEELRRAQEELEASRSRYFELYDLAPVGYFTLSEHSMILEANLTVATMLGFAKRSLTKTPLTRYILPDDQDIFYRRRKRLFETGEPQVFEVRVMRSDGARLWVRMEARAAQDGENGEPICRAVMSDITESKLIESAQLFLAQGGVSGEDFFESLASHLGESLGVDYVCIDLLEGDRLSARTLAVYFDGKFEDNVTYTLQDTPCGEVVKNDICCFPKDVRHLFPKDQVLQEMKAESYVGTVLWDSKGQPIGLIAVIGRKPLADPHVTESILRLVGVRAAGELERRQAEEALRVSEERFHQLFEDDLTGDFFCTPGGRILLCNPAFATIFGFSSPEEAVGTSMLDLYTDPGERDSVLGALKQERKLGRYEAWRKRRDGERIHVVENLVGHFDDRGELYEIKGYVIDDTERKHKEDLFRVRLGLLEFAASHAAEELLRESLDEISALTRSPIAFFHLVAEDQQTLELQAWSTQTEREFCRGEGKGRHYSIADAGVWVDCVQARAPVVHNDYESLPHRKGLPEGHPAVSRELVVPIMVQGRIVAILGVGNKPNDYTSRDIESVSFLADLTWGVTMRKRVEEALQESEQRYRALNAELELRVQERTEELRRAHDELEVRVEERTAELEAANKELESFSYSVSHDLRAPLRAVTGFAGMLKKDLGDRFDDETKRKVDVIQQNAERMGQLIEDLLALSRLGRTTLNRSVIDMKQLTAAVIEELKTAGPEKMTDIAVHDLPAGVGDPNLIRQVLSNLIGNAIKYTKRGEKPHIEITGHQEGNENIYCVKDNGVGFDMKYYDKLFGVFQRLHSTTEFEGTGVGLAIVHRIITRHGGRVWGEGKVHEGASFYFTLPKSNPEPGRTAP